MSGLICCSVVFERSEIRVGEHSKEVKVLKKLGDRCGDLGHPHPDRPPLGLQEGGRAPGVPLGPYVGLYAAFYRGRPYTHTREIRGPLLACAGARAPAGLRTGLVQIYRACGII